MEPWPVRVAWDGMEQHFYLLSSASQYAFDLSNLHNSRASNPRIVAYSSIRKFLRRKHRVEVVLDSRRSSSLAVSARSMASAGGISNWFDKVERCADSSSPSAQRMRCARSNGDCRPRLDSREERSKRPSLDLLKSRGGRNVSGRQTMPHPKCIYMVAHACVPRRDSLDGRR